jgi:uncharacterized protein (DUF924 family)
MQPESRAIDPRADAVLRFWFRGAEARKEWFVKDPAFDDEIRRRFLPLWEQAAAGGLVAWPAWRDDWLAYVVLCDQFPRNMFRGEARAFATDARALSAARSAIAKGWDRALAEVERTFAYLPFEHSEVLADQERALELFEGHPNREWAVRHWEVIRRFGRFPHRNAALGRESTAAEAEFLGQAGSSF